jgi:hypothetical protein
MKILALALLSALPLTALAGTECPENSKLVMACHSTPEAGDSEVAAGTFDAISVCRAGSKKAWLILEKNGEAEAAASKVVDRVGGSSYSVKAGDVTFSLSLPTGLRPGLSAKAKLSLLFEGAGNLEASSTYTCENQ